MRKRLWQAENQYLQGGGAVHGFDNHGTEDAKFLAISTPGVMSPDYFREIHEVLAAAGGPPDMAKSRRSAPARPNASATRQLTRPGVRPAALSLWTISN